MTALDTATGHPLLRRIVAASRWVFGPAALLFLLIAGWSARASFVTVLEQVQLMPLTITAVLWSLLHLLTPVFSWLVLREMGSDISYRVALGIHVRRLPARYLPGGIWHTVSRVMDLHRLGVSRSQLSVLVLLENLIPVGVALALAGMFLLVAGGQAVLAFVALLGGIALLVALPVVLRHRLLLGAQAFAASLHLKITATTAVFWLVAATAFACYWSAFPAARVGNPMVEVYAAYLLAWVVGFVSIFAPQGIGIFESVTGVLLQGALPFAGVAVLAAGFRAVTLIADVLAYAALHLLRIARAGGRLQRH